MQEKTKEADNSLDNKGCLDPAEDQNKRSYYYDDAHGYQSFDPDSDQEDQDTRDETEKS